jgi:hypothetical protein
MWKPNDIKKQPPLNKWSNLTNEEIRALPLEERDKYLNDHDKWLEIKWGHLSHEERKKLTSAKKEEYLNDNDEWFKEKSEKSVRKADEHIQKHLDQISNFDNFFDRFLDDFDLLFLTQGEFLNKTDFISQVKKDIDYYLSYFDDSLDDDEIFETMFDEIAVIEEKYKSIFSKL